MSSVENSDLRELVLEKIAFGENLIQKIDQYMALDGIQKLKRKIKQELNFLGQVNSMHTFLSLFEPLYTNR